MIDMVAAIDEHNFENKPEVRCFTCHEGHSHPLSHQLFADEVEAEKERAAKEAAEREAHRPPAPRAPATALNKEMMYQFGRLFGAFLIFTVMEAAGQTASRHYHPQRSPGIQPWRRLSRR